MVLLKASKLMSFATLLAILVLLFMPSKQGSAEALKISMARSNQFAFRDQKKVMQALTASHLTEVEALKKKMTELETGYTRAQERIKELESEAQKPAQVETELSPKKVEELGEKLKESEELMSSWKARATALENDLCNQYVAGFKAALVQAKFLCPQGNLDSAGPLKEIINGELVGKEYCEDPPANEGQGNTQDASA